MGRSVERIGNNVVYFNCSNFGLDVKYECGDCGNVEFDEINQCPKCQSKNGEAEHFYNEDLAQIDYDHLATNLICEFQKQFPSLYPPDNGYRLTGLYREQLVLLANDLVVISISDYMGCGALSVFVHPDCEYPELAENWIGQVFPKIQETVKKYVTTIRKLGTFSNGESVYEKIA